jgi:hypothetical protein
LLRVDAFPVFSGFAPLLLESALKRFLNQRRSTERVPATRSVFFSPLAYFSRLRRLNKISTLSNKFFQK